MRTLPLLLAFLAIPASAGSVVELRPEARVAEGYVALADIADVRGEPVPAIWLGRAPAKGGVRRVTADEVRVELRKAGLDLRSVSISGDCNVRGAQPDPRPGVEAFRDIVSRAISEAAQKELPGAAISASVLDVEVPEGTDVARVTIVAVKPVDGWWLGEARFRLYVNLNDTESAVWTARAAVRGTRPALVARRPLRAGHRVTTTDLATAEVSAMESGTTADESALIGRVLDSDVEEGRAVRTGILRPGPLVEKGTEIVVTSSNGRAAARRTATAMEEGRAGDVIRVKNPDSKKEFRVRVTGPGAGDAVEE